METLKQFIIDLYVIGQEMQKKPPDQENNLLICEKGSDPQSLNE